SALPPVTTTTTISATTTSTSTTSSTSISASTSTTNTTIVTVAYGTFLTRWGSLGSGDGQFFDPALMAVDRDGTVFVADTDNERIQKFTSAGSFLGKWGTPGNEPGQFAAPQGSPWMGRETSSSPTGTTPASRSSRTREPSSCNGGRRAAGTGSSAA